MSTNIIKEFRGAYRFLSNFWPASVTYEGITYPSSEAAYQAAKTLNDKERKAFAKMRPGDAKRAGRKLRLRSDWEQVKLRVMEEIVRIKFFSNPKLGELLLSTGEAKLREGNTWGDKYWGVVGNTGQNHLGKILMKIRKELKNAQP
jgi:ribA/ribD-fused uncharacterized protein